MDFLADIFSAKTKISSVFFVMFIFFFDQSKKKNGSVLFFIAMIHINGKEESVVPLSSYFFSKIIVIGTRELQEYSKKAIVSLFYRS